ncbi:hypothetical protein BDY21DRAFT_330750 [Lineolata rhizophorae]|uniref:Uncharacterized protein n=1 Tax=Lineolata rhizophorae TaxID=578093 RepID=A0A6A6PDX7_9PEZI|nr:hypothetical protein BDY21DRAFT_330750 [Lineolata rhizophorae]
MSHKNFGRRNFSSSTPRARVEQEAGVMGTVTLAETLIKPRKLGCAGQGHTESEHNSVLSIRVSQGLKGARQRRGRRLERAGDCGAGAGRLWMVLAALRFQPAGGAGRRLVWRPSLTPLDGHKRRPQSRKYARRIFALYTTTARSGQGFSRGGNR